MHELALFAGAGGGILGGQLFGWQTVCAVERDAYAAAVLAQRQNEGLLDLFPIWSDVTTFDGKPWRGIVDVVSGGFPCQDISPAGRGAGIGGERSGLWSEMARIIGEIRPHFCLVENSPILTSRGLGTVLGDLAARGYDAEWGVLGAADVGAPHKRERIWIMAYRDCLRKLQSQGAEQEQRGRTGDSHNEMADTDEIGHWRRSGMFRQRRGVEFTDSGNNPDTPGIVPGHGNADDVQIFMERPKARETGSAIRSADWWATEPAVGRVAYGVANRVDRLKALGNGQVPLCAAEAVRRLFKRINP